MYYLGMELIRPPWQIGRKRFSIYKNDAFLKLSLCLYRDLSTGILVTHKETKILLREYILVLHRFGFVLAEVTGEEFICTSVCCMVFNSIE